MSDVRVARCASYDERAKIDAFCKAALTSLESVPGFTHWDASPRLVVLKPNWVQEAHQDRSDEWEQVISHPEVVLGAIEAVANCAKAGSTICVCDSPHTYADFPSIVARGDFGKRFAALTLKHPDKSFKVLDLRREVWTTREDVVVERRANADEPRGYVKVDLATDSLLCRHRGEGRYYGADYDTGVVNRHHRGAIHEYLIAGTPMACDLFINVPKMKTHKKTGISCCLKNLVGINGDKNWLPHHTAGTPASGGDEFPASSFSSSLESRAKRFGQMGAALPVVGPWLYRKFRGAGVQVLGDSTTVVRNGNWAGNDTCWRMALDLNRALLYGNSDGTWRDSFQPKAYLAIVDGIVGGQGNGPLSPDPVESNVLVSGTNPAEVDAVVARLMGFDPTRIPIVREAFEPHRWPIGRKPMNETRVFDERIGRELGLDELTPAVAGGFVPHFGWSALASNR
jgi:uncharacterized protein (DUF362 family)